MSEVVALFSNHADADHAVSDLYSRGYDADTVGYVNRHRTADGELVTEDTYVADDMGETEKGVTGGAVGGAAVGAGTSLLASAGMLLIPGNRTVPRRWEPDRHPGSNRRRGSGRGRNRRCSRSDFRRLDRRR